MDPRHSASSAASPYINNTNNPSRSPFPPAPPPSHYHDRSPSTATYGQRPTEAGYPSNTAPYPQDPSPHSRASSLTSARDRDFGHNMPPPNSPPGGSHHSQHPHQQQPPSHVMPGYGSGPPPPRAPQVAGGHASAFGGGGRELPALGSLARNGPAGGSMSISALLGGPSRESQPPLHQYPPHSTAPPGSGPGFAPSAHASPRMQSASAEFPPFRRPHTPDRNRPYDPRASTALSPRGPYTTPEVRYGTPHSYHARHMSASADPSRDPARMSAGSAPPPRPNSQPKYPGMPRPGEDRYGRREEMPRPYAGPEYNPERAGLRPYSYDERWRAERERQNEIEHREQERREFERRERAYSGSDSERHPMHGPEPHREPPRNQQPYGRPPDARDPRDGPWGRAGSDPSFRAPMDYTRQLHEYPPHSAAPYPTQGAPYQPSPAERYPPVSQPPAHSFSPQGPPPPQDSPDRARMSLLPQHQQAQPPQQRQGPPHLRPEEGPPFSEGPYNPGAGPPPYDPRHRNSDDASAGIQRNLLAVQQENRKGRISPLPQAVQGAQPQQPGPGAEPGIKSEFGRMFSGIGSGVSGLGGSSPITSQAGPFTNAALAKRDDFEGADSGTDAAKGQKGRRRKLKDEEGRDDEGSGRLTPGHKAKRAKGHQHHHHHHHHHHHKPEEVSQNSTPFRNLKGSTPIADGDKPVGPHHHHHHHHGGRTASGQKSSAHPAAPQIPPRTRTTVSSQAVLDAASKHKRQHLGDYVYETKLKPQRLVPNTPVYRGFSSCPNPLPMDMIKGKINCTLTVKVPRVHLSRTSLEEITARGFLWGTDVYSDDSDVVAACIHSGWIRGEWMDGVDVAMLALDSHVKGNKDDNRLDQQSEQLIASPPESGPMQIPVDRDLHINVLILPKLAKYASTTRHGISSREFGGEFGSRHVAHDGLSYMVHGIRWVENGGKPQARLRGKARRERMRKAMQEVRSVSVGNISNNEINGEARGQITGNWWKKDRADKQPDNNEKPERQASEGDKENQDVREKLAPEQNGVAKDSKMADSPKDTVEMEK